MKYIKHLFFASIATMLLAGCYKDTGNYDYDNINKIIITDSAANNRIYVNQTQRLRLTPTITQSVPTTGTLKYVWFTFDNSSNSSYVVPYDTIGHGPELDFVIPIERFSLGQDYRLIFRVTDEATGISSSLFYNITIANIFAQGWMLYEDKSGIGDIAMITPDSVVHNVYSDRNKDYPLNKPVSFTSSAINITDDLSNPGKRIYLQMENDAIELNALTMVKKFDVGYLFFAKPAVIKPSFIGWQGYLSGTNYLQKTGIAINNGKVHVNMVGGFPGIKKWGDALITPAGDYNYNLAPFIAAGTEYSPTYATVVYDNTNKRFYSVGATALIAFPAAASTVFDLNNVGLDMIKMDSSNVSNQHNAIMKDAAGKVYLLRFKSTASSAADAVVTLAKTEMNAVGLNAASQIATSTLTPHIYYTAANKIYKYETTSNTYTEQFSFASNETITKIVYKKADAVTGLPVFVAATWNGSQGKVYKFTVSSVGNLSSTYTNSYTGFAKIVDIVYKVP